MTMSKGMVSGRPVTPGRQIAVVIPARNEVDRLPRCLAALAAADGALQRSGAAGIATRVVVVLDRSTDGSRELLADWPAVEVVESDHGRVGAARAAGVRHVLRGNQNAPRWIACTDADSAVPADWLITQLTHAAAGVDLLLGLVAPDPAELDRRLLRTWRSVHLLEDGHPHIHGANLGISADMYRRVGGFRDVALHEDVLLVTAVRSIGGRVVSTASSPVLTSARMLGRTPAGMAGYLDDLSRAARARHPGVRGSATRAWLRALFAADVPGR
ncbi:GT2 family glycosyltransferase [Nakamurella sp. UYEF19]|uniref:glycosyltransferase n=1 Tax=Nakamurella sp. UYEF19 TaxID=1756392 RepID=UPI00339A1313